MQVFIEKLIIINSFVLNYTYVLPSKPVKWQMCASSSVFSSWGAEEAAIW